MGKGKDWLERSRKWIPEGIDADALMEKTRGLTDKSAAAVRDQIGAHVKTVSAHAALFDRILRLTTEELADYREAIQALDAAAIASTRMTAGAGTHDAVGALQSELLAAVDREITLRAVRDTLLGAAEDGVAQRSD